MNILSLVGLTLDQCRFSKSSYEFMISGKRDQKYDAYSVSTPYYFSLTLENLNDAEEKFSLYTWGFLERKIYDIQLIENDKISVAKFIFDNSKEFIIWAGEPQIDNLLLVTNVENGEWFTVL